jgi:hypothetical protein
MSSHACKADVSDIDFVTSSLSCFVCVDVPYKLSLRLRQYMVASTHTSLNSVLSAPCGQWLQW